MYDDRLASCLGFFLNIYMSSSFALGLRNIYQQRGVLDRCLLSACILLSISLLHALLIFRHSSSWGIIRFKRAGQVRRWKRNQNRLNSKVCLY